ncbi:MAG: DUF2860 family protein [Desulfobacterales bacterium]|jgi:hypothetical protein
MKKPEFLALITVFTLVLATGPASAFREIANESGFNGFVRLGGGVSWAKSNMIAGNDLGDVGQRKIDSLTSKPDSESDTIPQFDFNLRYTFASAKTEIFLGTRLEDILRYDATVQAGVRKQFLGSGIFGASFVFTALPTEVWKDPYVVNDGRKRTDRDSRGFRVFWEKMFGSQFEVDYTYRRIDIDDENSAQTQLIPGGIITASQAKLLDREGDSHQLRAMYTWQFADRHVFTPSVWALYEDLDGDAMKNYTIDFQPTYGYIGTKFDLVLNASIGYADYDEKNPIYGKTNNDVRYGIGALGFWKNPFGWQPFGKDKFRFYANGAYFNSDADIDFYKTAIAQASVGVWFGW